MIKLDCVGTYGVNEGALYEVLVHGQSITCCRSQTALPHFGKAPLLLVETLHRQTTGLEITVWNEFQAGEELVICIQRISDHS